MWHDLYLLASMLTSFLESTSTSTKIINQNIYTSIGNEDALETSRDTIDLPSSLSDERQYEMPDFSQFARRISEKKCMEYIYEMLKRQEHNNLHHSDSNDVTIINGKVVKEAEYPHMGALGWWAYSGSGKVLVFMCGASLISDHYMLTAAHCTYVTRSTLVQHEPYLVRLGSRYLEKSPREAPKDVIIRNLIRYSNKFKGSRPYYDIALVELDETVQFTKFIQPACLSTKRAYPDSNGKKIIATGWGSVNARSSDIAPSRELRSAEITIFDTETCNYLLNRFHSRSWMGMHKHQLCAGELDGNADTCKGDSGGPLQYVLVNTTSEGTIHRILAVTAFGLTRCARENAPGVYSEISYFINWIERIVWPREYKMFDNK